MGVSVLAAGDVAEVAGRLTFLLGIPLVGLICLIIGLWTRARSRRQPRPAYPYPPGPPTMGYPGPYPPAPYPGTPYPGYPPYLPPQPRAAKSSTTLIVIGSVVLAIGGLGILGNIAYAASQRSHAKSQTGPSAAPQIGQCFTDWDVMGQFNKGSTPTDCNDPKATEELVSIGGSTETCPDGRRESSVYDVYFNEQSTLCFAANLKEGQCYMKMDDGKQTHLTPIPCDDPRYAQIKVLQRINGSTDTSQCPPGSKGISYPAPARTYCIEKAGT